MRRLLRCRRPTQLYYWMFAPRPDCFSLSPPLDPADPSCFKLPYLRFRSVFFLVVWPRPPHPPHTHKKKIKEVVLASFLSSRAKPGRNEREDDPHYCVSRRPLNLPEFGGRHGGLTAELHSDHTLSRERHHGSFLAGFVILFSL